MPEIIDSSAAVNDTTASGDASVLSSGDQMPPPKAEKKKRNLPGMPDPDAEVIALSPKTLMATNRFVCEICNKGFQRDQNLQLHRRGHNLPWKLRQRSSKEIRKRVYVCPEESCIHHDPSRALGDLTGIKKHYFRKHGEKKWKCEKCSKKYAVQSDWKAHSKICGTREYKCDCGTLFSRRDSFITHRAFCDALAVESAKEPVVPPSVEEEPEPQTVDASPPSPLPPQQPSSPPSVPTSTAATSMGLPDQTAAIGSAQLQENPVPKSTQILDDTPTVVQVASLTGSCSSISSSSSNGSTRSTVFASLFASSTASGSMQSQATGFTDFIHTTAQADPMHDMGPSLSIEPTSLSLATNHGSSIFGTAGQECRQYALPPQPAMSATALLQKAAQMGATATNASLLRGLGVVSSSSSAGQQHWNGQQFESGSASLAAGLGLGLPYDGGSGLKELMMGTPSVFDPKYTTLDLLGLGMAAGGGPTGELSALMTSIGSGLDASTSFGTAEYSGEKYGRSS
ncbi:hypothetical protein ACET3Z_018034 [Daucus carota]